MRILIKILLVITLLNVYFTFSVSCSSKPINKLPTTHPKTSAPKTTNTVLDPAGKQPANANQILSLQNNAGGSKSIVVPFNASQWHSLKYNSIPSNTVQFSKDRILIKVKHSASPLIYPMTNNPLPLTGIAIEGHVDRLNPYFYSSTTRRK